MVQLSALLTGKSWVYYACVRPCRGSEMHVGQHAETNLQRFQSAVKGMQPVLMRSWMSAKPFLESAATEQRSELTGRRRAVLWPS